MRRDVSSVAILGTNESGTFSDSTRISVEDLYRLGMTKKATIERSRTADHGTTTNKGRRSGAYR